MRASRRWRLTILTSSKPSSKSSSPRWCLGKVIEQLNLNEVWGKSYNGGQKFTTYRDDGGAQDAKLIFDRFATPA